jgi:hypothetical protein
MLGALDTRTSAVETLLQVKEIAEGIAYAAPEVADTRAHEIISNIRRVIREWEAS